MRLICSVGCTLLAFALSRRAAGESPEVERWPAPAAAHELHEAFAGVATGAAQRSPLEGSHVATEIDRPNELVRIRGVLVPPAAGEYRFAVAGDDFAELQLSEDATPFRRRAIANVNGWTHPRTWNSQPGQLSDPVLLEPGKPVYFELLAMNTGGGGHAEIGWKRPGNSNIVPLAVVGGTGAAQVLRYVALPEDADDDGLPDAWQLKHELSGMHRTSLADPDHDGSTNLEELLAGTHPKQADLEAGKLRRETWSGFPWAEAFRQRLRFGEARFPKPAQAGLSVGLKPMPARYPSLQKFRGYLTPPASGDYRFSLCGQGKVRLELSPDDRVLMKRIVADGGLTMQGEPVPIDKPGAFPDSAWIPLEAGKRYYFEVYYWIERDPLHIRWEWTKPDGRREQVPVAAMSAFTPPADDADQDDLPDAWEREMGLAVAGDQTDDFATGDPDHDGLTSGEEYLQRLNPRATDTDRDGVDDGVETRVLGTSPRDRNRPLENGPAIDLFAAKPLTYGWSKAEGGSYGDFQVHPAPHPDPHLPSLVNATGAGTAEWTFPVEKEGIHLVTCGFQQVSYLESDLAARTQWWIDGEALPEITTQAPLGALQRAAFLTPKLSAGTHTLKLRLRPTSQTAVTRIFSLSMDRVTDRALEEVTRHLAKSNRFTRGDGESATSPACIEARTRIEEAPVWRIDGAAANAMRDDPKNTHAEVRLREDGGDTHVSLTSEKGAVTVDTAVKWKMTDVMVRESIIVREGDRLRLAVAPGAGPGERALELDGETLALKENNAHIWSAGQAGQVTITGIWQAKGDASPKRSTLTVTVVPGFPSKVAGWSRVGGAACWVDAPGQGRVIDGGDDVVISPHPSGRLGLLPKAAGDWVLPVRAGDRGPLVGSLKVRACKVTLTSRWSGDIIEVLVPVENPPPDAKLHLTVTDPQLWECLSGDNKAEAWLPLTQLNDEGWLSFYAARKTDKDIGFVHDVLLVMPDGSEW